MFKDWLTYHCAQHGLEAVVMLLRSKNKWVGKSAINRLLKAASATAGLKTFAVLESNMPLGQPDYPSVLDRHTTPDGPGKALLDPFVPDAYASALYSDERKSPQKPIALLLNRTDQLTELLKSTHQNVYK